MTIGRQQKDGGSIAMCPPHERVLILVLVIVLGGCGQSGPSDPAQADAPQATARTTPTGQVEAAAARAASLANERCKKLWDATPFRAEMHTAELRDGRWHWGKYNPAGPDGFSAEVSFREDGSDPQVRVYFSTDAEMELPFEDEVLDEDLEHMDTPEPSDDKADDATGAESADQYGKESQ
jgi:hypothetical protein